MIEAGVDPDKYREILRKMIQNGDNYAARRRPKTAATPGAGLCDNAIKYSIPVPTGMARTEPNYATTSPGGAYVPQRPRFSTGGRGTTPADPWRYPVTAAFGGRVRTDNENRDRPKQYGLEPYKHAIHLAVDSVGNNSNSRH